MIQPPEDKPKGLRFDGTVNLSTLITTLAIVFSMIVGFVRNDDRLNAHEAKQRSQDDILQKLSDTQYSLAINQAVMAKVLEQIDLEQKEAKQKEALKYENR